MNFVNLNKKYKIKEPHKKFFKATNKHLQEKFKPNKQFIKYIN